MNLRARARARFHSMPIQGKITVVLVAVSVLLGGIMAGASFLYSRHLILSNAEERLQARAMQMAREQEIKLSTALSLAESLASNTITANSLADSVGRNLYMEPLLKSQKLPFPGALLVLADYRGRILTASSEAVKRAEDQCAEHPAFQAMMLSGQPAATLEAPTPDGTQYMVMAYPVYYRLTGNVEGGLVLRIPLADLRLRGREGEDIQLLDQAGLIPRHQDDRRRVTVVQRLDLPPPLEGLGLSQSVGYERHLLLTRLNTLLWIYAGFAVALGLLILLIARTSAHHLATPLQVLAGVAEKIARSGRPGNRIAYSGQDEFGRLAGAFNTMIDRLQQSYADLESQVQERTRALSESAARLRYVMEATGEGVWDWNVVTGRVTHNHVWCDMLGLGPEFVEHDFQVYPRVVHPEDLAGVQSAIEACLERGSPYRMEYRMVRASGETLWVQDRGNVVEWDAAGRAIRMVGSIADITARVRASQALKERELYLRATLDNLPFLFWLKDANSRFLIVNKAFSDACGRSGPDEVAGLTDLDVWPLDLAEMYRADDRDVIDSMTEKAVEEPVQEDGQRGWIETFKKPVIAEDGTVLGTVGFARNITDRKMMEVALRESEQRWGLAVSGANDGIWDWRPRTGEVFFSDRWKTILGYAPNEFKNSFQSWEEHVHPDDLSGVKATLTDHFEGRSEFFQTEFRMRCKDGTYKWILSKGKALFDNLGQPIRMCGSHSDISQRRAAEAEVRDRTELLNNIFILSPDGFVAFDSARRVNFVSPAFLHMTGLSMARVIGLDEARLERLLDGLCAEPGFPPIATLRGNALEDGQETKRQTLELLPPVTRILEVGLRLGSADRVSQILYFRDITHEAEVDRMKSEFLSTAAHELRTPMSSIYGFSQLLLTDNFDPEMQKELLQIIFTQSELMVSIINELLDLARIEARQGKDFVMEDVPLAALLDQVLQGFKPPEGRTLPELVCPPDCPEVRADRKKLTQALNNILSNAYKYSPEGGAVEIRVISPTKGDASMEVGIEIRDRGIGMTPAQLERVFERFYRVDTSGKIPGTGLGMSIVKEIIELHHGRIHVASEKGHGTQVTLWLPLADASKGTVTTKP